MKHPAIILTASLMLALCSCQSTALLDKALKLGELGLTYYVARGDLKPGDVITISRGLAIVRSPGNLEDKTYALAELGLEEAVRRGLVKEGEQIVIDQAMAIIREPGIPAAVPTK